MKKRIFSVLLSLVLVFTLASCAKNETPAELTEVTTSPAIEIDKPIFFNYASPEILRTQSSEEIKETEPFNPWKIEDCFPYYPQEEIETMELEEVQLLVKDMLYMSKTAMLSPSDMNDMGWMFHHIWYQCPKYDKETLEFEYCEVFENIYYRALEINLPLDALDAWLDTPIVEISIKYISSDNFEEPYDIWGRTIINLSEEDLLQFTKAFVNNPLMETNATIARTIICTTDNEETSKLAWEHLLKLSNSNAISEFIPWASSYVCTDIFDDYDLTYRPEIVFEKVYSSEYIVQIAENILDNPAFDFVEKYEFFCSNFLLESNLDVEISRMAMDKLQDKLAHATYDECLLIARALSNIYYNEYGIEMHNVSEELHEKYIYLLTYCLARMSN